MKILVNSSSTALWHDIIHDAEANCSVSLKEELEAYLVFLLMRYTNKPELIKQVIAVEFMQGLNASHQQRSVVLQDVGDKCLLLAGLYPKIAEKRLVRISYFVNLGQSAYTAVSKKSNDLYELLSLQFVSLMDILQSIRIYTNQHPDLLPLQAYELWNETGSQRALATLQQYSKAIPLWLDCNKSKK